MVIIRLFTCTFRPHNPWFTHFGPFVRFLLDNIHIRPHLCTMLSSNLNQITMWTIKTHITPDRKKTASRYHRNTRYMLGLKLSVIFKTSSLVLLNMVTPMLLAVFVQMWAVIDLQNWLYTDAVLYRSCSMSVAFPFSFMLLPHHFHFLLFFFFFF